jgi:DMSO/TMAO reductase YedYZ molybdopterin-dependent catalytic subunit
MKKPGAGTGAVVGLFVTAALVAILFVGWRALGLPFAPFDLFDWTTRKLPGGLVTFGIDSMVRVIRALGVADTSAAAKAAEQAMAVGLALAVGTLAGALLFAVLRGRSRASRPGGLLLGTAAGLVVLLIERSLGRAGTAAPAVGAIWNLAAFMGWGALLGWAQRRLSGGAARSDAPPAIERVDRRRFIVRLGAASATVTLAGAVLGELAGASRRRQVASGRPWSADHALPNAGAALKPAPGTRPELTPLEDHYRIDISTTVPVLEESRWRLKVGGLVERPRELTLAEIRGYEPLHQFVTLACISNPVGGGLIGTTRWTGVSLQRLLPDFGLKPAATHLKLSAADGFHEVVSLETIRGDARAMLTYAWDGLPLAAKHGFPLRIYIPDLYGMKQPKWLTAIEGIDHWEAGYWVKRGWDRAARMKATSVIDTVSVDMMLSEADEKTRIPIGGIAHAGARRISRVEVRVDEGPWNEAAIRPPLSGTTWVLWRYEWPFRAGSHTFTVRCVEGEGAAQIVEPAPPHPSGAAGLHSKAVML